jgi:hypothetical protein
MAAGAESRIKKYLKETFNLRNIMERVPVRVHSAESTTWELVPWSLESVSTNCRLPIEEVTSLLKSMPDVEIVTRDGDAGPVSVVRWLGVKPPSYSTESTLQEPGRRVRDLINLHIYNYLEERRAAETGPVKLEDALFDLKNSVMLPDDFIPDYLMGNLEGEDIPDADYVVENLQPFAGRIDTYCYFELSPRGSGGLAYLYAASRAHGKVIGNQDIERIIGSSFKSLSKDPDYVHFELSRYIRSIIFGLERYRSTELRRPLPPPHIIELMERKGIIAETGGRYSVQDGISAADLEKMLVTEKNNAKALSTRWLDSLVEPA